MGQEPCGASVGIWVRAREGGNEAGKAGCRDGGKAGLTSPHPLVPASSQQNMHTHAVYHHTVRPKTAAGDVWRAAQ